MILLTWCIVWRHMRMRMQRRKYGLLPMQSGSRRRLRVVGASFTPICSRAVSLAQVRKATPPVVTPSAAQHVPPSLSGKISESKIKVSGPSVDPSVFIKFHSLCIRSIHARTMHPESVVCKLSSETAFERRQPAAFASSRCVAGCGNLVASHDADKMTTMMRMMMMMMKMVMMMSLEITSNLTSPQPWPVPPSWML